MRTDSTNAMPSVKLFPRLAMSKRIRLHATHRTIKRRIAAANESRESRDHQVRARLLRMILDNEEARRNDRRPSAG